MIKRSLARMAAVIALLGIGSSANAHFQLLYTPEVNVEKVGALPFRLIFWHPMEAGHVMDMGKPEEFYMIFRGEKTDLMSTLKPITFQGTAADNKAAAYAADVEVRRNGDYILALTPAPYYEKSEDKYIQQLTKSFVNKGGVPTGWNEPLGLKTEIVPLNKPTNILAGSTFTGQVLGDGKPVAGIEIEIEYMAAEPDMDKNTPTEPTFEAPPGGAIVAVTDANGMFTFGVPRAGFWGFAALGSGPDTEFEGKELSQDAVIWIRAY